MSVGQWKYDYLTATYFLLLEKKMKGRPVRLLHRPAVSRNTPNPKVLQCFFSVCRDADFPLFSIFFCYFWPDPFSANPFSVFFPQLFRLSKVYVNILYFLLFHLSLSELSVSFCVHFL